MAYGEIGLDLGFFRIHFIENNGMAFGTELGGETGKLALSLFRVLAIILIGWYLTTLVRSKAHKGLVFSIALIFSGAFGNILDSVFYGLMFDQSCDKDAMNMYCAGMDVAQTVSIGEGYAGVFYGRVVDMFQFNIFWPEWLPYLGGSNVFPPIFNLADGAISLGVIIIILKSKSFFPQEHKMDWNIKNWFKKKKRVPTEEADTENKEVETQNTINHEN